LIGMCSSFFLTSYGVRPQSRASGRKPVCRRPVPQGTKRTARAASTARGQAVAQGEQERRQHRRDPDPADRPHRPAERILGSGRGGPRRATFRRDGWGDGQSGAHHQALRTGGAPPNQPAPGRATMAAPGNPFFAVQTGCAPRRSATPAATTSSLGRSDLSRASRSHRHAPEASPGCRDSPHRASPHSQDAPPK
jgi:hypothetical protein